MPNLKASIKDLRKSKTRTKKNIKIKNRCKKSIKALNEKISNNETDDAKKQLSRTYKLLDKAAKKKIT